MTSPETPIEAVLERLTKLERQNHRLKQIGVAALVVAASLTLMGQASKPKTVEASELILRDGKGNVRATLSMNTPKGATSSFPQLVLFDERGKKGAVLETTTPGFSGLILYDDQERERARLSTLDRLGASLLLDDDQGNLKTRLKEGEVFTESVVAWKDVEANQFALKDDNQNTRARLFVTVAGVHNITLPGMTSLTSVTFPPTPTLALYDEKGGARVILDNHDIGFFDSQGNLGGQLGGGYAFVRREGGSNAGMSPGSMWTTDDQGFSAVLGVQALETQRTGETQKTSAASLILFDKNKSVIWKAP